MNTTFIVHTVIYVAPLYHTVLGFALYVFPFPKMPPHVHLTPFFSCHNRSSLICDSFFHGIEYNSQINVHIGRTQ